MDLLTKAKINRLLQMREQIYERIKDSEELIMQIAGFNFPLPLPPVMPASNRSTKLKVNRTTAKSIKIPPLKKVPSNAYQFTYILNNKKYVELIKDIRTVRKMLSLSMPDFIFLRLDSVSYDGENIEIIENIDVNLKVSEDKYCID